MYLCMIVSAVTIYWLGNQQNSLIVDLGELKVGLRMTRWLLLAQTVGLAILTWICVEKITSNNNQEIVESTNLRIRITEQAIEKQKDKEKKEIMSIYLSSGASFFHEIDSMKLSSQEIIDRWKNMPLGGELIVEDSDGWSAYKKDEIVAITILFE